LHCSVTVRVKLRMLKSAAGVGRCPLVPGRVALVADTTSRDRVGRRIVHRRVRDGGIDRYRTDASAAEGCIRRSVREGSVHRYGTDASHDRQLRSGVRNPTVRVATRLVDRVTTAGRQGERSAHGQGGCSPAG
jgi:hypothetical protein